jgi:hypothetical protein
MFVFPLVLMPTSNRSNKEDFEPTFIFIDLVVRETLFQVVNVDYLDEPFIRFS